MFDFDVLKISEAPESEGENVPPPSRVGDSGNGTSSGAGAAGISTLHLDTRITSIPRGPALMLSPEAGVASAMEAMRQRGRGAVVVVQNHRPVGVVTDRDILTHASAEVDDLRAVAIGAVMSPCPEPLRESDSVATALRTMCARRQWHLPIVCHRGLFLGALDIADLSLWLRDRLTLLSVDAAFGGEASL